MYFHIGVSRVKMCQNRTEYEKSMNECSWSEVGA